MKPLTAGKKRLIPLTVLIAAIQPSPSRAQCTDLTKAETSGILKYISSRYHIPASVSLNIRASTLIDASCFRHLVVEGKGPLNTWSLELFLSPDHRFVSTDLMDTALDPKLEEMRRDQEALKHLSAGSPPARGMDGAKVTIVEFSDFECPYCRSFEDVLSAELKEHPDAVRVLFRHFPLANHSWARKAAEGAACAQLQNPEAFWEVHDQIFALQDTLNLENIDEQSLQIAERSHLDSGRYKQCIENQMSMGLVLKDIRAAALYEVTGTPTVFINGKRVDTVKTVEELDALVNQAKGNPVQ